jgi:Ni,Fe-hydrogenase maturation factor
MKKLYVFGNEYLQEDSLARIVSNHLHNVELVHCRSPEDLLDVDGEIVILDVVKGITKTIIITDVNQLKTRNIISLHDFDLGFFLKLMESIGEKKTIKIIGIPMIGDSKIIALEVEQCLVMN